MDDKEGQDTSSGHEGASDMSGPDLTDHSSACEENTPPGMSPTKGVKKHLDSFRVKTGNHLQKLQSRITTWRRENCDLATAPEIKTEPSPAEEGSTQVLMANELRPTPLPNLHTSQQQQNMASPRTKDLQVHKLGHETRADHSQQNKSLLLAADKQTTGAKLKTAQLVLADANDPAAIFKPPKKEVNLMPPPIPPRMPTLDAHLPQPVRPSVPPRVRKACNESSQGACKAQRMNSSTEANNASEEPVSNSSQMVKRTGQKSPKLDDSDIQDSDSSARVTIERGSGALPTVRYSTFHSTAAHLRPNETHSQVKTIKENRLYQTENPIAGVWRMGTAPATYDRYIKVPGSDLKTATPASPRDNSTRNFLNHCPCPAESPSLYYEDEVSSGLEHPPYLEVECTGSSKDRAPGRVVQACSSCHTDTNDASQVSTLSEQTSCQASPKLGQHPTEVEGFPHIARTSTPATVRHGPITTEPATLLVSASSLSQHHRHHQQQLLGTSPTKPDVPERPTPGPSAPPLESEYDQPVYYQQEIRRPAPQRPVNGPPLNQTSRVVHSMRGYSMPAPPWREVQHPPPLPLPPTCPCPSTPTPITPPRYMFYDTEPRPYMPTTEPLPNKESGKSFLDTIRGPRKEKVFRLSSAEGLGSRFVSSLGGMVFSVRGKTSQISSSMRRQFSTLSTSTASHDSGDGSPVDHGDRSRRGSSNIWIYKASKKSSQESMEEEREQDKSEERDCLVGDAYSWLLLNLTCCCCWPVGLASWILAATILQGRKGPAEVCIQATAKQLTWYALLAGISFYLVFLIFYLSLLIVSVGNK